MTFPSLLHTPIPEKLKISNLEVHVWRVWLDDWKESFLPFLAILDYEELQKAARFRFEPDRQWFLIKRIILKKLLSLYLGITPQMVRFRYNPHGKPHLSTRSGGDSIQFNTSHSQGLAVYVVSRQRHLGVDLESLQTIPEIDALLSRWFPPRKAMSLQKLPTQEKHLAFYRWWTQREAYLKALGKGLGGPRDIVDFFLKDIESARPNPPGKLSRVGSWSFHVLTPAPNFVATVAVEGDDYRLYCFKWEAEVDIQPALSF